MANTIKQAFTSPMFEGVDFGKVHDIETLPQEKAEQFTFETVDFSDPNRPLTCLEVDFPIIRVNEVASIETNASKPIYMMSKWWARRRSSVFRQLLIAAATKAPSHEEEAAQAAWSLMYRKSHRRHKKFNNLHVVDIFMGGGTTVVEAARMGFRVTGIDLNPIAWWITKNEVEAVPPEQVLEFGQYIEEIVKPQIMPFFTARSPRGNPSKWIDIKTNKTVRVDPIQLPPLERAQYRWEGPEVIYTFWMKHVMCSDPECNHLTPQVNSSLVATKTLKLKAWPNCVCPNCGGVFDLEQGNFRMAPTAEFVLGENIQPYAPIEMTTGASTCPHCSTALEAVWILDQQKRKGKPASKDIEHNLLLSKDWLKGVTANSKDEFGGYYGASEAQDTKWFEERSKGLKLVEVRGNVPRQLDHTNFTQKHSGDEGAEEQSTGKIKCGRCGREQDPLTAIKLTGHLAPIIPYLIQGFDPQDKYRKQPYSGRFFDVPDIHQVIRCISEYSRRAELKEFVPNIEIPFGHETHQRQLLPSHGYTHWYKMFNPRQLYVNSLLLQTISEAPSQEYAIVQKSQLLGAFQNFLRHNCMFTIWNIEADKLEPHFSNNNYHPKATTIENSAFGELGRGNFRSCLDNVAAGVGFARDTYDLRTAIAPEKSKSIKIPSNDSVDSSNVSLYCHSSTSLSKIIPNAVVDLVITDPPFGDNLNYSELSEFFFAWLQKPLSRLYPDTFNSLESPKALEAVTNKARHPGEAEDGRRNADVMYDRLLTMCWKEAHRILKAGGTLAFTFHHDKDIAWVGVLESLFQAGFYIEATYPVRSDETKGKSQFGSKKIEYDVIHVCRKITVEPTEIYWATLRRQILDSVKSKAIILAQHKESGLHLADLEVMIRGEVLEQYSKHFGKVRRNLAGTPMSVKEVLFEANAIASSLLQSDSDEKLPDDISPEVRVLFSLFREGPDIERNAASKRLKGSGFELRTFESLGWIEMKRINNARVASLVNPLERWNSLSRKQSLTSDLDQVHFAINCCAGGRLYQEQPADFEEWLLKNYKHLFPSVKTILKFIENNHFGFGCAQAIGIAQRTLDRTIEKIKTSDGEFRKAINQMSLFDEKAVASG